MDYVYYDIVEIFILGKILNKQFTQWKTLGEFIQLSKDLPSWTYRYIVYFIWEGGGECPLWPPFRINPRNILVPTCIMNIIGPIQSHCTLFYYSIVWYGSLLCRLIFLHKTVNLSSASGDIWHSRIHGRSVDGPSETVQCSGDDMHTRYA